MGPCNFATQLHKFSGNFVVIKEEFIIIFV